LNNCNKNCNKASYTKSNIFLDKDDLREHIEMKIKFSSDCHAEQQILLRLMIF
jgi:hypothetical protein